MVVGSVVGLWGVRVCTTAAALWSFPWELFFLYARTFASAVVRMRRQKKNCDKEKEESMEVICPTWSHLFDIQGCCTARDLQEKVL